MNFILKRANSFYLQRQRSQVSALMQKCDTCEDLLLHAAIGIVGEVVELIEADEPQKRVEEMGDLLFYHDSLVIWQERYSPPRKLDEESTYIPSLFTADLAYIERTLLIHSTALLDLAKKVWAYGQTPRFEDIEIQRRWLLSAFQGYAYALSTPIEDILENNWQKLSKRYPDHKFTTQASIDRADEKAGG